MWNDMENMEESQAEQWEDMANIEERQVEWWKDIKIWKKPKLNSEKI
jgi:hypothetical protein